MVTNELKKLIERAEAVVIGAGAGLSTSAGFRYDGENFRKYFAGFEEKYGFHDMYSGGFYPFETLEEMWAFWSRNIYINRYMPIPKGVYDDLYCAVKDKDYFVITTNVDHCFQRAGFDRDRLFYTQGDYGLWQCSEPCHNKTYDNEEKVREMVKAQGFFFDGEGRLLVPEHGSLKMTIPSELVPVCPVCGKPMIMNLRSDGNFVEDEGWHEAVGRYTSFIQNHRDSRVLFLELGVGLNTPGIIKFSFWQMVYEQSKAAYACLNLKDVTVPREIAERSVCIQGDIGKVLTSL